MQQTQRLRRVAWRQPETDAARSPWFVLLPIVAAAWIAFDVALVMLPDFGRGVIQTWHGLAAHGAGGAWISWMLRTGFAMGGAALGIGALVAFARGVTSAPFAWLSPVLVGFATVVVAFLPVKLPLPISVQAYAFASAFLLLGGGALLQGGRATHVIVGTIVIALPVAFLALGYASPNAPALVADAKMMFFVLGVCSIGIVLIAALAPAANDGYERAKLKHEHEQQVAQLMQHVRVSEERVSLAHAEIEAARHSLRVQGEELEAALSVQDEAAVLTGQRRRAIRAWLSALTILASVGGLVAGYFMAYQPLVRRVHAREQAFAQLQTEHKTALQRERELAASESARVQGELTTLQAQVAAGTLALGAAQGELATLRAQLEAAATAQAEAPKKTKAVRQRAQRARVPRAAARRAAPAAEPAAPASPRHQEDSNDPIGGLDL